MNTAPNRHASIALAGIMCLGVQSSALAHPATGIVVTEDGTIYFAYAPGSSIWKVTPDGKAEPFVTGGLDQEFRVPHNLYLEKDGNLITASDAGSFIWRISMNGEKTKIFPPGDRHELLPVAAGGDPFAITPDGRIIAALDGTLETGPALRLIDPHGEDKIIGGSGPIIGDGRGDSVGFEMLHMACFAWGPEGDLYMTQGGSAIRRVTLDGEVTTIAGSLTPGHVDAAGREARFNSAVGLTVEADGAIYVAEPREHCIRRIDRDGAVTTFAGTRQRGDADGPADKATFDTPVGITHAKDGTLYILEINFGEDGEFARIRRINPDRQVTTVVTIPADKLGG